MIHLFFTLVENREDGQYFYVAKSESIDFSRWTSPVILTEKDKTKNYSSPGNVIQKDEEYILCLQSYPRPNGEKFGNDDSHILFFLSFFFLSSFISACAATTMMYEAEALGVHNVWLRGFDAKTVAEVFDLPENIIPVMMFAMGYPSDRAKPNAWHYKRMPPENFVTEL